MSTNDELRWAVDFSYTPPGMAGAFVGLAGGDLLVSSYCGMRDSGVRVLRLDPSQGKKRWETYCRGPWVAPHSIYFHGVDELGTCQIRYQT